MPFFFTNEMLYLKFTQFYGLENITSDVNDKCVLLIQVRINHRFNENVCMRQSSMISMAISNIRKDLLGQPLQLLSGVDILGNASSALGHMSKGVAALSMDKKFIQSRQRQVLSRLFFFSCSLNLDNVLPTKPKS